MCVFNTDWWNISPNKRSLFKFGRKNIPYLFKGSSKDPFEFKLNEFPAETKLKNYEQEERKKVRRRFASSIHEVLLYSDGLLNYEEDRNMKLLLKFDIKVWILFGTMSCGCQIDKINISNLLALQKQFENRELKIR